MDSSLRTTLFVSYSRADCGWRDAFRRQLGTMFVSDELWIDGESIEPGDDWRQSIQQAVARARCALVLLTPAYLDQASYARRELQLLLDQAPPLKLLPVLVEDCAWQTIPELAQTQLLRWRGDTRVVDGQREELAPLTEAPHAERAIVEICQRARKEMGVVGQARPEQIDALAAATQAALGDAVQLLQPVFSGAFSVVYRARMHDETVAVKAVPEAPRLNRLREVVTEALPRLQRLTDPAFIRLRASNIGAEPHWFVMDFVDWPTIEQRLPTLPGHRVDPDAALRVLLQVARAHVDAHEAGLALGPLPLSAVHVDDAWQVRLAPLRIEGVMARAAHLASGQLMNWDALTYLAPEVSAGQAPAAGDRAALDALDQYHLGVLGLEMLLGRQPCEVRCFDDLAIKARFFDDPRPFLDEPGEEPGGWVDRHPALAWLLLRLLARDPAARLPGSAAVLDELQALASGQPPPALRAQLDADLELVMQPAFAEAFYARLVSARPGLVSRFNDRASQARMLVSALPDLLAYDPRYPRSSRFHGIVERHAGYGIDHDDVDAFRSIFLAQIDSAFGGRIGHVEAWRAALDRGLAALAARVAPPA
ncbi:MAG: TIR domain-containing protein [Rubrivivax sp.]